MPKGHVPNVFVSSTCYDLMQVRADLQEFIESLGFRAVLSEYASFPVDPNLDAVNNCLRVVDDSADIFILVVGGRYGSMGNSGKAITNMEYIRAKAKGVPCYTFVLKSVLSMLPVWEKNPTNDYSGIVDSTRLFEFVRELREPSSGWVFPFEKAQDIKITLKAQLAYLFAEGLGVRLRLKQSPVPPALSHLTGEPLRFLLERPRGWEYLFLDAILREELDKYKGMKMDIQYGTILGKGATLDHDTIVAWITEKANEASVVRHISLDI